MTTPIETSTAPIEEQAAELRERAEQLLAELAEIGGPYKQARDECVRLRDLGEPIVVQLAKIRMAQGRIADAFCVTRETIRRIEITHGIDRGDPRAQRGPREVTEDGGEDGDEATRA
jgi:hypothetical protein